MIWSGSWTGHRLPGLSEFCKQRTGAPARVKALHAARASLRVASEAAHQRLGLSRVAEWAGTEAARLTQVQIGGRKPSELRLERLQSSLAQEVTPSPSRSAP
jgi:hypothetical protein